MKKILGILLIFVFPSILFSAPSVSGVSGTFTHGQSITVSGTGFGTKSVAAPSLYDKVEGTYTTTVTDGGVVPVRTSFGGGPQEANAPFQYNADGHNHVRFETASGEQRNTHSSACYKTDGTGGAWLSNAEAAPI